MNHTSCSTFWLIVLAASSIVVAEDSANLPKVVLVGDSIRLSYAPIVGEQLAGKAIVISPKPNGGDSNNVLKHLDDWVIKEKPDVVHLNCGIHDTKKFLATGQFQVSPEQYESNLRRIVERIRAETEAVVVFATSTPILDERAAATRQGRAYELLNASIERYNAIAKRIMDEKQVPINDIHKVIVEYQTKINAEELIGIDGVHLTEAGKELAGTTVASTIENCQKGGGS